MKGSIGNATTYEVAIPWEPEEYQKPVACPRKPIGENTERQPNGRKYYQS